MNKLIHILKLSNPIADIIGIVLMMASFVNGLFYDDILLASKFTLHFPILVSLFLIFFRRVTLLQAGLISWLAFLIFWIDFVEDHTHVFLRDIGFFRLINYPESIANVTIFIYYYAIILVLGILIIPKKNRTPERTFSFLSTLAVFTVTYFIHNAIPRTAFAWNEVLIEKILSRVVDATPKDNIRQVCEKLELSCNFNVSEENLSQVFESPIQVSRLKISFGDFKILNQESATFALFRTVDEVNVREVYYVKKNAQGLFDVFMETKLITESERVHEAAFAKLLVVANFVWGWLFLIIGIFHTKPLRKKVWIDT